MKKNIILLIYLFFIFTNNSFSQAYNGECLPLSVNCNNYAYEAKDSIMILPQFPNCSLLVHFYRIICNNKIYYSIESISPINQGNSNCQDYINTIVNFYNGIPVGVNWPQITTYMLQLGKAIAKNDFMGENPMYYQCPYFSRKHTFIRSSCKSHCLTFQNNELFQICQQIASDSRVCENFDCCQITWKFCWNNGVLEESYESTSSTMCVQQNPPPHLDCPENDPENGIFTFIEDCQPQCE